MAIELEIGGTLLIVFAFGFITGAVTALISCVIGFWVSNRNKPK